MEIAIDEGLLDINLAWQRFFSILHEAHKRPITSSGVLTNEECNQLEYISKCIVFHPEYNEFKQTKDREEVTHLERSTKLFKEEGGKGRERGIPIPLHLQAAAARCYAEIRRDKIEEEEKWRATIKAAYDKQKI